MYIFVGAFQCELQFVCCFCLQWAQKERQIKAVLCRHRLLSKHLVTPPLRLVKLPNTCSIVDILGNWKICSNCFDIDAIRSHLKWLDSHKFSKQRNEYDLQRVSQWFIAPLVKTFAPTEQQLNLKLIVQDWDVLTKWTWQWNDWVSPTNILHNFFVYLHKIQIRHAYLLHSPQLDKMLVFGARLHCNFRCCTQEWQILTFVLVL